MFLPLLAVLVALGAATAAGTAAAAPPTCSLSLEEQRDEALQWMQKEKKGVRAALQVAKKRWPALVGKRGYLDYAVAKHKRQKQVRFADDTGNAGSRLLTDIEEYELAVWCRDKNRALDGAYDDDVNSYYYYGDY